MEKDLKMRAIVGHLRKAGWTDKRIGKVIGFLDIDEAYENLKRIPTKESSGYNAKWYSKKNGL